jgi:phosphoribosylformimino-5-aminoimidazole carboxamide ribotide isomerase
MRIIPVLDLMNGQVVHATRGERDQYRPVQSLLVSDAKPLSVARALQDETGCDEFYIADLDAILGRGAQYNVVQELADELKSELWVDAGISNEAAALEALNGGATRVIICSETLPNLDVLRAIRATLPSEQLVFSVDIMKGQVVSRCSSLHGQDPLIALDLLSREGWSHFIILTLDQVGTGGGPDWSLLKAASHRFPRLSLIAGGGVRTPGDLQDLAAMNISGVLVATSLHRGWITRRDLEAIQEHR